MSQLTRKRSSRRLRANSPTSTSISSTTITATTTTSSSTTTTTTAMEDGELLRLREELTRLRDSTKSALMESWAEVEHLQVENAVFEERTQALQFELVKSRDRETKWQNLLTEIQRQHRQQEAYHKHHQHHHQQLPPRTGELGAPPPGGVRKSLLLMLHHKLGSSCSSLMDNKNNNNSSNQLNANTNPAVAASNEFGEQRVRGSMRRTKSAVSMNHFSSDWSSSPSPSPPPPPSSNSVNASPKWSLLLSNHNKKEPTTCCCSGQCGKQRKGLALAKEGQERGVEGGGGEDDELLWLREKVRRLEDEKEEWMVWMESRESVMKSMEQTTLKQEQSMEELIRELRDTKAQAASKEAILWKQLNQLKKTVQTNN